MVVIIVVTNNFFYTCRTLQHLVELFQKSLKESKGVEINLVEGMDPENYNLISLEVFFTLDFFENIGKEIDLLTNGDDMT